MKIRQTESIVTERLVLRPHTPEDRERLAEMLMDEKITETFMVPEYPSREKYLELADLLIRFSSIEDEAHLEYGIYCGDELIGFVNDCGFDDGEIEIGYVIHPDYQNRGFASEAVKAVIDDLRRMGFPKITAGFFEENPASFRVMEKCGMKLNGESDEGEYRGVNHRCIYCEICF